MSSRAKRPVNHPDFAAKLPQNDPLIQMDGLRDSEVIFRDVGDADFDRTP